MARLSTVTNTALMDGPQLASSVEALKSEFTEICEAVSQTLTSAPCHVISDDFFLVLSYGAIQSVLNNFQSPAVPRIRCKSNARTSHDRACCEFTSADCIRL